MPTATTTATTTKKKRAPKTLPKVLDRADIQKILAIPNVNTWTGLRNRVILQVMWRAGLRVQEVCNLSVADIDLERGTIYVQLGKGERDRKIPVNHETVELLAVWIDQRNSTSEWFFPTSKGTQLDQRYVREMLYRASKKAGVFIQDGRTKKKVHPHCLRHCYATELLESGKFNIAEVQQLLGHSNLNTTQKYLSVRPFVLAEKMREWN